MDNTNCVFLYVIILLLNSILLGQNTKNADSLDGYSLIWYDEFDDTKINKNNWSHEIGTYDYNGEVQYYTDRDTNSFLQDGKLIIKALHEHYDGSEGTREFTSARIVSKTLGDWKYGRIEVKAKLPSGVGTWPAIWLMPTESVYGYWPSSGEIDIMEHVGHIPGRVFGTVHTAAYNHRKGNAKGNSIFIPDVMNKFHIYSIEWTKDFIEFFVDGNSYFQFNNEYKTYEEWPFDQKFYAILNVSVGGGWGGQQGIDSSAFPTQMEIDYIRVYEKNDSVTSEVKKELFPVRINLYQNYPNPFNPTTIIEYSIPPYSVLDNDFLPMQLSVYDILGNEVKTLVNEIQQPGNYKIKFDGSSLASGVYYYKLQCGSFAKAKIMVILK